MNTKQVILTWRQRFFDSNITQTHVAENTGVSLSTLNKIIGGVIPNPTVDTFDKIEGYLRSVETQDAS